MAQAILILGESGTGKTTSLRNLKPSETIILQVEKKELPFRGARKDFPDGIRCLHRPDWTTLSKTLLKINAGVNTKVVIIDDFQYLMSNEMFARARETGYGKFTEVALHFKQLIDTVKGLRDDLTVCLMAHTEQTETGRAKMKTAGKMIDNQLTPEGLFTIVFVTEVTDNGYKFVTNDGINSPAKSPMDMFKTREIDNDLAKILPEIEKYYGKAKPVKKAEEKADGKQ